jgi:hypothetical protein
VKERNLNEANQRRSPFEAFKFNDDCPEAETIEKNPFSRNIMCNSADGTRDTTENITINDSC